MGRAASGHLGEHRALDDDRSVFRKMQALRRFELRERIGERLLAPVPRRLAAGQIALCLAVLPRLGRQREANAGAMIALVAVGRVIDRRDALGRDGHGEPVAGKVEEGASEKHVGTKPAQPPHARSGQQVGAAAPAHEMGLNVVVTVMGGENEAEIVPSRMGEQHPVASLAGTSRQIASDVRLAPGQRRVGKAVLRRKRRDEPRLCGGFPP